jgi:hypothetical protein
MGKPLSPFQMGRTYASSVFHGRHLVRSLLSSKIGKVGVYGGIAYLIYNMLIGDDILSDTRMVGKNIFGKFTPAKRSEYISSSILGTKYPNQLMDKIIAPNLGDTLRPVSDSEYYKRQRIMDEGTGYHRYIQDELLSSGIASDTEVYFEDPINKVFGYADVMLKGGIPMEIKSVDPREFDYLRYPKREHISQANFYAIAAGSHLANIMYISRGEPAKRKVFSIYSSEAMYAEDISNIRQLQEEYGELSAGQTYSNYRPLSSILSRKINYDIPLYPSSLSDHKSKIRSMRAKLPLLPQYTRGITSYDHPNTYGSRSEAVAE